MKKFFSKLSVFVLALTLSFSAVFSTACKVREEDNSTGQQEEPVKPTNTGRGEKYTFDALGTAYGNETVSDLIFKNGAKAPLKDYMLGDAFNEFLKVLSSSMATMRVDSTPSIGIDISKWFGYDYYTDGHWYSRSNNKMVHEVLDLILSYELDGSQPLDVNDDVINEYADETLITVMPTMRTLIQMDKSGMLAKVFNVKIGEVAGLLSGNKQEIEKSIRSILGDVTVAEIAPSFGVSINENSPKMLKAVGELKLSYVYELSAMKDAQLYAEAKKFLAPYKVEDLLNVYGVVVDETAPKMLKGVAALTFNEIFTAFEGKDGGAAFVGTLLDTYTIKDVLELCDVKVDENFPAIVKDFSEKKLSEVLELLYSVVNGEAGAFLQFAQTYSLCDVSALIGKEIDENSPLMLRELKDKKIAELLALSEENREDAKKALVELYGKYTVKDFYEAMGQDAPEGSENESLETIVNDLFELSYFDGMVGVAEKYFGDATVGTLYSVMKLPVKSDMTEVTLKSLSQQAKTAAAQVCPAEKPENITEEEYAALQNEQFGVYFVTFAKLAASALDTEALRTALAAQIKAMLSKAGVTEILPGVTIEEMFATIGDEAAAKAFALKVINATGVKMSEEEFKVAYETYVAPVFAQLKKTFNEDVIVGDYTIVSFFEALMNEQTREEALKTIGKELNDANGDFAATPAFAKLVASLTELENASLGSIIGMIIEYAPQVNIKLELGGVKYQFTLESFIEFVVIVYGGGDETVLLENEFYVAVSQIKVKDLLSKAEEIINKIIASIPNEPVTPPDDNTTETDESSKSENSVDLPKVGF